MDGEPSPDAAAAAAEGNWSRGVNESEEWLDYYEEYETDYIKIFVLRWDGTHNYGGRRERLVGNRDVRQVLLIRQFCPLFSCML